MSIATELNRIQTAKANIKTAVANKGVTIPDNKLISEYADYIDSIPTGCNFPIYTSNLAYACCDKPQAINWLNNTQILGAVEQEIEGTTNIYRQNLTMNNCFYRTTFTNEDPIGLTNKAINASYNNYTQCYFSNTFNGSIFSGNYENQQSKITFKNGYTNASVKQVYLTNMFDGCNISNFKDIELDFTNLTSLRYLFISNIFSNAITGNNGFKITNLPFYHLNDEYRLNSNSSVKVKIKKITSNGEKLRYDLDLKHIDMSRNVFMEFITSLGAVTSGTITIYIDTDVYNLLTSDDLAAVAAKNYTLSH